MGGDFNPNSINGPSLLANYVAAVTNIITANTAQFEAERSEQVTMSALNQLGHENPVYLTPQDIPPDIKDQLIKSSLDAHLKKAQSAQIGSVAKKQVDALESAAKLRYRGVRAQVRVVSRNFRPFEAVWFEAKSGQYVTNPFQAMAIKGIIDDVLLSQNILVIRPTLAARTFWPSRKLFIVQVIDPNSLSPMVEINLARF